jgi:transposase
MELLDAIPACAGARGRPRSIPKIFQGDHAYGTPRNFKGTAERGITAQMQILGQRKTVHGSGLGKFRYVVERTLAWLGHNRRLKICYEKTKTHFEAFNRLAASLICARRLAE